MYITSSSWLHQHSLWLWKSYYNVQYQKMQKWAFTLFCPLVFDFCWQGEDGQPLLKCSGCAAAALSQAEPQGRTIVLQRTLSEKLHFRTCPLHCLHPSLQAWYREWHISEPCWKSGCNCQFKLILACIIKETVIHTQMYQMDLITSQTGKTSHFFFFFQLFSGKYSCEQGFGLWSFLLSACCLQIASLGEFQAEVCWY